MKRRGMRNRNWWVVFPGVLPLSYDWVGWRNNFLNQSPTPGLHPWGCGSKASSETLPNGREEEDKVPGGARSQGCDLTILAQRMIGSFPLPLSSHSFFTALFRGGASKCPALPVASDQALWEDTPATHKHSQGPPWLPNCHLPNLIPWVTTYTPLRIPRLTPQASSQSSLRARTSEILGKNQVFHSLATLEDSSKDIQVRRESHVLGSQRLGLGDQVLNCCPLWMLNSKQSAPRSAIITIDKNSPFVSRAWRAFEI